MSEEIRKLPNLLNPIYSVYDMEDMFLGAIISGKTDGEEIIGKSPEWFVQKDTRLCFDVLKFTKETTGYCDYISIRSQLQKDLGSIPTQKLLERLQSKVPEEYNPKTAADKLEEYFIKRQANMMLEQIREAMNAGNSNPADLFAIASEKLDKVINTDIEFDLNKELSSTVEGLIEGTGPSLVIKTGFNFYDNSVGGIPIQEITVIGARPGHGKTTSTISLSLGILETNLEMNVAIYELEMSKESLKHKILSNVANVDYEHMRLGTLTDEDKIKLQEAVVYMEKFKERLFIFDDVYDLSSMNKINKIKKINVAFVDYIQLMDEVQADDARKSFGRMLVKAKRYTKRNMMAYVFYSQLNRLVDIRDGFVPQTSDLSESDLIGHIASDVILLSYRYKYTKEPQLKNLLMWYFDKARYASVGQKGAGFDPAHNKLYDNISPASMSAQYVKPLPPPSVLKNIMNRK